MHSRRFRPDETEQFFQTTLSSYGVNIGFRVEWKDGLRSVERFLPFGCNRSEAKNLDIIYYVFKDASGKFKLYAGARKVDESYEIKDIFLRFQSHSQLFIATHAHQRAFIHAGVVAVGARAILMPGRSYAGKTTLVTEFIKAGAVYYSDEYAVLDQLGRVHPYPKPLSMRNKTTGMQRDVAAESLGARTGAEPLPVGVILVTKYKNGASWRAKEAGSGAGIIALTMNSVSIRQAPEPTLRSIARAASGALVLKSARGDAQDLVKDVMRDIRE
ncbi:MAG TPA: hypothetical protein VJ810_32755 [Blastocatellia bacterium]|nr:hypothetical protein [Blastocatellia bacterium]